ncbi:hypothetical protein DAPPUDRAFT_334661 [Daphnia pulex]|uniref:Uncharacterized protein n=1 Tax=Daphnia pulex TaxID=6669 RepID=E9HW52_DAPPU|nr:hypothetical protein DAPPUDRAFT_334661 [Daphnia pulex]|eukprot:EFX64020.1 hypothetical protein DAPPUDRAFT_334661 [Daphnia pulex]
MRIRAASKNPGGDNTALQRWVAGLDLGNERFFLSYFHLEVIRPFYQGALKKVIEMDKQREGGGGNVNSVKELISLRLVGIYTIVGFISIRSCVETHH